MTSAKAEPGVPLPVPDKVTSRVPCALVVGLGASAGGLEPLERFFTHVPLDMGISYVVVQHLSSDHPSILARIIAQHTKMPVVELVDGLTLAPDHIYVLTPGTLAAISGGKFNVVPSGAEHRGRIDVFLESLAEDQGERAVGILLSGAGSG
jgi:two-component system, chemotaxis family, CheB/CheR fusion protein